MYVGRDGTPLSHYEDEVFDEAFEDGEELADRKTRATANFLTARETMAIGQGDDLISGEEAEELSSELLKAN